MRYHSEPPIAVSKYRYGKTYKCNHPVYNSCTLYLIEKKGLAVIQQRFDLKTKSTYWTEIDDWLVNAIYMHEGFFEFFKERASEPKDRLYPTVTIRQLMWAIRMKPLQKQRWETTFDRRDI